MYEITKFFTSGILAGLTYTETTRYPVAVGFECRKPIGGSPYRVIFVRKVSDTDTRNGWPTP